jgi:hypothetical protein
MTEKPNQFRVVITDQNQSTAICGTLEETEKFIKWHEDRGEPCHVEARYVKTTEWERV